MTSAAAAPITGTAAGVPFVALPPERANRESAPLVVAWHLMDPPRTPAAFAAAVPLAGLDAWRVYLGLPLMGDRAPAGSFDETMRLAAADLVRELYEPVVAGAASEFPAALAAVRDQLGAQSQRLGLMGGSAGSMVAQLVLTESDIAVEAAVLLSPFPQIRPTLTGEEGFPVGPYRWDDHSNAVADRLDFVARAGELAASRPGLPLLTVLGEDDETWVVHATTEENARLARTAADPDLVPLVVVPGLEHALAEEPGIEAAPQIPHAAEVDRLATDWFRRHLL